MRFEVMLEGDSDVPVVREVFQRRFGMKENLDFRLHAHQGKGALRLDPNHRPELNQRGLLDQLPAKLRGMSHLTSDTCILVLLDLDKDDCVLLLGQLKNELLNKLGKRPPNVEFRLAIEEIESWLIADHEAVKLAFPRAKVGALRIINADARVGAWEMLAKALGLRPNLITGADKFAWATEIAPHLNLDAPKSPSFRRFISAIERLSGKTS